MLLVERDVTSLAELHGIVAAYVEHSTEVGAPAVATRRLFDAP